jgi:hypothetical protein
MAVSFSAPAPIISIGVNRWIVKAFGCKKADGIVYVKDNGGSLTNRE